MNIALGAVIIFILLIPPIAFYLSYSFGNSPKAGPKYTLLDGILASAIVSLLVHATAIFLVRTEIRFDVLLKVLGGDLKDIENKLSNAGFAKSIEQFALYNFTILIIFILLGRLCRWIVIRTNRNAPTNELFRLNNRWWYLFNGMENAIEAFDLLLIDAVVDTAEGTIIYSGFLVRYICTGEQLERIYLSNVVRREFKVVKDGIIKTGEPVPVPGEIFSVDYKYVINLNLKFIILPDDLDTINELPETSDVKS